MASIDREAPDIEAGAKRRLADEYDAAQERGEVATRADQNLLPEQKKVSVAEIGLTHKDIHEARIIRDAEEARESAPGGDRFLSKSGARCQTERENSRQQPCRAWLAPERWRGDPCRDQHCQRLETSRFCRRPERHHYAGRAAAIQDPHGESRRASSLAMFSPSRRQCCPLASRP